MKKTLTLLLIIGGIMNLGVQASEWEIDASHSSIGFAVKHMMITTVRGEFKNYSAIIQFDENKLENSRIEATIDVASVDSRNEKRDEHLKSADFFDESNHPQIKFQSMKISNLKGNSYSMTGNLTIRGITKEITLNGVGFSPIMKNPWGQTVTSFSAETVINRKDFNLMWNVALEAGGVLVAEDVKIELNLELLKK